MMGSDKPLRRQHARVGVPQVMEADVENRRPRAAHPSVVDVQAVEACVRAGKRHRRRPPASSISPSSWHAAADSGTRWAVFCLVVAPGLTHTPVSRSKSDQRAARSFAAARAGQQQQPHGVGGALVAQLGQGPVSRAISAPDR